ncbi:cupin-like domain-containing protein [Streptomyces sp. NPDC097640]|uniref:cupin-like domain-containing protein n=1 Tax=Streptomyces sp. NPDC097640 TaxID=3157229 RepID=UPI0033271AEC
MTETATAFHGIESLPVPRLSLEEFTAWGRQAIIRADVPMVVDLLPEVDPGVRRDAMLEKLGDSNVALFTKKRSPGNDQRAVVTKIRLRDFFDQEMYNTHTDGSYRIVSNIKNRPDAIDHILGFDALQMFDYQAPLNSANIWVSYNGLLGRNHFDEFENFNIQLEGRKRFIMLPPGYKNYYIRSVLQGYGHHSKARRVDNLDPRRFPRLVAMLAQRRDIVLEPGQMLYLPLGWWHQVDGLDRVNININVWLRDQKIFRRPYVLGDALYKAAFRRLNGFYDYQAEKSHAGSEK